MTDLITRLEQAAEKRFLEKVSPEPNSGCWLWVAGLGGRWGYGNFWNGKRNVQAHRWSYERWKGPIPDGLQIDHLCRVHCCVNPDHLEAVTCRENIMRGNLPKMMADKQRSITHCANGHEYTEENTYIYGDNYRKCRICRREKFRAWAAKNRPAKGLRRRRLHRCLEG